MIISLSIGLSDVVAFVEVRTANDNRSAAVTRVLERMGARVEEKLSEGVTHVIFKEGKKRTRDRAQKLGAHLVSVLWVDRYYIIIRGDRLAQWLERWTGDPKVEGLNPVMSTRKTEFFRVKKVVPSRYRCAQPPCVYICTHTKDHVRTLKIL